MPLLRPRLLLSLTTAVALTLLLLPHPSDPSASILTYTTGIELSNFIPSAPRFKWSDWRDPTSFSDDPAPAAVVDSPWLLEVKPVPPEQQDLRHFDDKDLLPPTSPDGLTYHPNGYLLVQDPGTTLASLRRHPIHTLIHRAQAQWKVKLDKQSKTLEACVQEYVNRYHRTPPYGFEKWWAYAVKHNVSLKDEYDQINRDIVPFLALEPGDLLHRSWVMANQRPESFTLSMEHGEVHTSGSEAHLARATDLADILRRFSADFDAGPVINMTFTKHDQPTVQMSWGRKEKMWNMAAMGEYFSPSDYVKPANASLSNWANACPPDSALYMNETNMPSPLSDMSGRTPRSYIYDHLAAMDPCSHPESKALHGFTSAPGTDNAELVPMFTFAKTTTQSDILVTPLEQFSDTYIGNDPIWQEKTFSKLLWRGSTTGAEFRQNVDWWDSQRARLHFMTHEQFGEVDVLLDKDKKSSGADNEKERVQVQKKRIKDLNERLMATSFSGGPVQCDAVTCEKMSEMIQFAPTMGLDDSYQYKYLIDVDGNGWSGRFHRLMSTKSLVLKSTIFPEWYNDRVMPWVHYVPIKVDYSDLYDVMSFFVGSDTSPSHDDIAEKIATSGKEWARDYWRREDMASYMFRLALEWRRVLYRGTGYAVDYVPE